VPDVAGRTESHDGVNQRERTRVATNDRRNTGESVPDVAGRTESHDGMSQGEHTPGVATDGRRNASSATALKRFFKIEIRRVSAS
jgi:hypothetical protein